MNFLSLPFAPFAMTHALKQSILPLAAVVLGVAVFAGGGDDDATETPITGTDLQKAIAAALAHTAGGRVTGTEVGDEEGYYEFEVRSDDGSQSDVHLDRDFNFLTTSADDESSDDKDEPNDDKDEPDDDRDEPSDD